MWIEHCSVTDGASPMPQYCTADGAAAHGQQITKRNNAAYKIAASTRSSRPDQKRNTSSQLRKAKSVASACGRDGGCRQRRQSRVGGSAIRAELPGRATCATAHARRIRCRAKADQPEHRRWQIRTSERVVWAHMRALPRESQRERSCQERRARGRMRVTAGSRCRRQRARAKWDLPGSIKAGLCASR
jgi:hypothetical protein